MTVNNHTDIHGSPNGGVFRVCFVCTGNICRSPMAEWVLRARVAQAGLADRIEVDSAGTGDWHVGDGADPRTVQVLTRHGYPSRHVARQLRPEDLRSRDLVVALDAGHLRTLKRWAGGAGDGRPGDGRVGAGQVGDGRPGDGPGTGAELRLLREFDPAAGPGRLDVPDPYYGSLAGFEECLAMVEAAVPGLLSHIGKALETRAG
jgi:protein-tyrosine phosphatase